MVIYNQKEERFWSEVWQWTRSVELARVYSMDEIRPNLLPNSHCVWMTISDARILSM